MPQDPTDEYINKVIGAFKDPLIVVDAGWAESLPEWIRYEITLERLARTMEELKGQARDDYATDAETFAYLQTASLCGPLDQTYFNIYAHLFNRYAQRRGVESPFQEGRELTDYESGQLSELKRWIRKKQLDGR